MLPHEIGVVPDRIGSYSALPARARAPSGRSWWNRAVTCAGASSEFYESYSSHRKVAERPPMASKGRSVSLEARGGVVPHGIRVVPDGIRSRSALPARARAHRGQARWNRVAACAGASSEFCESSLSCREATAGLRMVARPLRKPGAAWCLME